MDRRRYDSAMFWLPFGTAAAVIGLALMTIGVTRLASNSDVFTSPWFDGGLGLLAVGGLLLLWSLWLFIGHKRREKAGLHIEPGASAPAAPKETMYREAIRGYYKERQNLIRDWQKERKDRG